MGDREQRYTVGRWKTLPHYRCTKCRFDTFDRAAMERHIELWHTPRVVRVRSETPLVDRFGNPITKEVIVNAEG